MFRAPALRTPVRVGMGIGGVSVRTSVRWTRGLARTTKTSTNSTTSSGTAKASGKQHGAAAERTGFVPNVAVRKQVTSAERARAKEEAAKAQAKALEPDDNLLPPLQLWKFFRISSVLVLAVVTGKALGLETVFEDWRKDFRAELRERDAAALEKSRSVRDRDPKSVIMQLGSALVIGAVVGLSGGVYFSRVYKPKRHKAVLMVLDHLKEKLGAPEFKPLGRVRGTFEDNSAKFHFETRVAKGREVTVSAHTFRDTVQDVWKLVKWDMIETKTGKPISPGLARSLREADGS
ncbi:Hypothetical Protein FCC1311_069212 [Hondaea fermentalgiana]|uniref:Uncharacterized protein n=1 Tax=Hondaea fermentalgiana TaxID=2315210 RepID=A0A2R5GQR9_9STRA|nr:Hypothetical Protein FCC1311_069212 [Hondaea fermentalgiana]|eukprot:GBG30701.1 Hypothetical Protein FCC1311_069212 [Hondaea fermentalgiana]